MNRNYIILALLVLAFILAGFWWATNRPEPQIAATTPTPTPAPVKVLSGYDPPAPVPPGPPPASPATTTEMSALFPDSTPAPWEKQIDNLISNSTDERQTALALISILPGLPDEGKAEAAHHATNLLEDQDYNAMKPILLNPNMPEDVLNIIFTDAMNRGDEVKLRAFLDVARISNHPLREEALTDLQIFIDADYGQDWAKWSAAVEQYIKENTEPPQ